MTQGKPATLAEFTMLGSMNLSYYDISLVDGYNLPLGIVSLHNESSEPELQNIPSNTTNPVCIGSPNFLEAANQLENSTTTIHSNFRSNHPGNRARAFIRILTIRLLVRISILVCLCARNMERRVIAVRGNMILRINAARICIVRLRRRYVQMRIAMVCLQPLNI